MRSFFFCMCVLFAFLSDFFSREDFAVLYSSKNISSKGKLGKNRKRKLRGANNHICSALRGGLRSAKSMRRSAESGRAFYIANCDLTCFGSVLSILFGLWLLSVPRWVKNGWRVGCDNRRLSPIIFFFKLSAPLSVPAFGFLTSRYHLQRFAVHQWLPFRAFAGK